MIEGLPEDGPLEPLAGPHGTPWHGLVQGGTMDTGSTTRSYPQPSGGDTFAVGAPGLPAPAAPYRNTAMISGANHQFYGQNLGAARWPCVDGSGNVWLVNAGSLMVSHDLSAALDVEITLTRFGYDYGANTVLTLPVELADWQQVGAPAIENEITVNTPTLPGDLAPFTDITDGSLRLIDLSRDGTRALFALVNEEIDAALNDNALGYYPHGLVTVQHIARPLGFYELTLTPTSATLSIIANRATALGTPSADESAAGAGYAQTITLDCDPVDYEYCATVVVNSGTNEYQISDRILAYWYDAADDLQPVTLDRVTIQEYNDSAPAFGATTTISEAWSFETTLTLTGPNGSITHLSTIDHDFSGSYTVPCAGPQTFASSTDNTYESTTLATTTVSSTASGDITGTPFFASTSGGVCDTPIGGAITRTITAWERYLLAGTVETYTGTFAIWRYSNNLIGLVGLEGSIAGEIDAPPLVYHATGKAAHSTHTATHDSETPPPYHGSHDPISSALSIDTEAPCCYV